MYKPTLDCHIIEKEKNSYRLSLKKVMMCSHRLFMSGENAQTFHFCIERYIIDFTCKPEEVNLKRHICTVKFHI